MDQTGPAWVVVRANNKEQSDGREMQECMPLCHAARHTLCARRWWCHFRMSRASLVLMISATATTDATTTTPLPATTAFTGVTTVPPSAPPTPITSTSATTPSDARACPGNLTHFYRPFAGPTSQLCESVYYNAVYDIASVCTSPFAFTDPNDGSVTTRRGFTVRSGGACTALTESDCWWLVAHLGDFNHQPHFPSSHCSGQFAHTTPARRHVDSMGCTP